MALSYRNNASSHILMQLRNIRYANAEMLFGYYNSIEVNVELYLDPVQLFHQADVFAREILTHRSQFDMKRFLGSYQQDWLRILSEAYVYDRLKSIYYGINSVYMMEFPSNICSFPGNTLLANFLAKQKFNFSTNDSQPFSLYVNVNCNRDLKTLFKPIFEICPDLEQGMSDTDGVYSYINTQSESVLKGLFNAKLYLEGNAKRGGSSRSLFELGYLNDDKIKAFTVGDNNPIINSFLSKDGNSFFFIMPTSESKPEALRFNESIFIARALGFTGEQLTLEQNNFYTVANRNYSNDMFTREEVYSVTGLRSEIIPYSMEQIKNYLNINTVKDLERDANGGRNDNPPSVK